MASDLQVVVGGNALPVLQAAGQRMPQQVKALTTRVAGEVQREAKVNVRQALNTTGQAKGNLSRGITILPNQPALQMEVGPQAVYGAIHEFGGVIRPKQQQYLSFQPQPGQWVRVASVTMPKRPYLAPAVKTVEPKIDGLATEVLGGLFRG